SGDAHPDEPIERYARGALDDTAEDIGVVAIDPGLTGLGDERYRSEPLHRVADRLVLVGGIPPEPGSGPEPFSFVERCHVALRPVRNAGGVSQKVADGNGTLGWNDRDAAVIPKRHGGPGIGREESTHRVVDSDLALFDEGENRRGRDGLRLRGDAEDRVGPHAPPGLLVAPPDGALVHRLAVAEDQRDGAANPVVV